MICLRQEFRKNTRREKCYIHLAWNEVYSRIKIVGKKEECLKCFDGVTDKLTMQVSLQKLVVKLKKKGNSWKIYICDFESLKNLWKFEKTISSGGILFLMY